LLNDAGFSCIKLDDYIRGDFSNIANGRKPIILTFDDGWKCHFSFLDKEGTIIDPDCVVGILENFYKNNPLFGKAGVFFVYMDVLPFTCSIKSSGQTNFWKKKLQYLENNGFEIGCHTYHHKNLLKSTEKQIFDEFALFYNKLETAKINSIDKTMFLAYPWGVVPKNEKTITNYSFNNNFFKSAFLASRGYGSIPFSKNKDPYQIPRISGYDSLVKPTITQKTFTKQSYSITLPKVFLCTNKLLSDWIKKYTVYDTKYLLQDTSIIYAICRKQ
jgi:peptidoglycan/xylan/chitin deacetylase (PgdA/CDA1 family)